MTDLNILIVEGNDPKNNEFFVKAAKASCSQNLKIDYVRSLVLIARRIR